MSKENEVLFLQMLGSRISDMLDQELSQQQAGSVAFVTDESRQKQLLQEDEEEDFLDEGKIRIWPLHTRAGQFDRILIGVGKVLLDSTHF